MTEAEPTGEAINIKRLKDEKRIEFPLEDLVKYILGELPSSDKINDEIRLSDGESYVISSLKLGVIKPKEEEKKRSSESQKEQ